jgi:hypothetical protein
MRYVLWICDFVLAAVKIGIRMLKDKKPLLPLLKLSCPHGDSMHGGISSI